MLDRRIQTNPTEENTMKMMSLAAAGMAALLAGCAASPELVSCLQPNRRVAVEVSGIKIKPPAKPGAKPGRQAMVLKAMAQGDTAWDTGSAVLKDGGKEELDALVANVNKRKMMVGSIIITGHTDRFEAESANANLSEQRAKTVADYLASKGLDSKLMFWEGKGAKEPVPVTKFCE